jgi:hypothetical protein
MLSTFVRSVWRSLVDSRSEHAGSGSASTLREMIASVAKSRALAVPGVGMGAGRETRRSVVTW